MGFNVVVRPTVAPSVIYTASHTTLESKTPSIAAASFFLYASIKIKGNRSPMSLPYAIEKGEVKLIRLNALVFTFVLGQNRELVNLL